MQPEYDRKMADRHFESWQLIISKLGGVVTGIHQEFYITETGERYAQGPVHLSFEAGNVLALFSETSSDVLLADSSPYLQQRTGQVGHRPQWEVIDRTYELLGKRKPKVSLTRVAPLIAPFGTLSGLEFWLGDTTFAIACDCDQYDFFTPFSTDGYERLGFWRLEC